MAGKAMIAIGVIGGADDDCMKTMADLNVGLDEAWTLMSSGLLDVMNRS